METIKNARYRDGWFTRQFLYIIYRAIRRTNHFHRIPIALQTHNNTNTPHTRTPSIFWSLTHQSIFINYQFTVTKCPCFRITFFFSFFVCIKIIVKEICESTRYAFITAHLQFVYVIILRGEKRWYLYFMRKMAKFTRHWKCTYVVRKTTGILDWMVIMFYFVHTTFHNAIKYYWWNSRHLYIK